MADRLHEGHRLDVTRCPTDLAQNEIVLLVALENEVLDRVRDVRNDLDSRTEIVAPPLLRDDLLIDPPGRYVVHPISGPTGETLVMSEVEVRFSTVVSHEDFAVLRWAHRARIDVQIRVKLAQTDPIAPRLQKRTEGR
ncbi:hypothetical protein GGQ76_001122 [Aureimonas jatrophae]|nr:hypothetical protein [Aureimonas jatrophae]